MKKPATLDTFLINPQCDDFAGEWEEQQEILKQAGFEAWLDNQEKKYWENLAEKSEDFSCNL
jgi:hypothetical protein